MGDTNNSLKRLDIHRMLKVEISTCFALSSNGFIDESLMKYYFEENEKYLDNYLASCTNTGI